MKPKASAGSGTTQPAAGTALNTLARDDHHAAADLAEARQHRIHFHEVDGDSRQAKNLADDARQQVAALRTRHDPAGVRTLALWIGAIGVGLLAILDVVPLNWAAQAFDLAVAGTWLVTGLLLAASLAAMLGFEMTRANARKRTVLIIVVTLAYLGLLVLRLQFLMAVAGEPLLSALLQAVLLTAVSAGLVLSGSAVMARTQHFAVARAQARMRRATQVAEDAAASRTAAARRMQRSAEVLLLRVHTAQAPAGVDHVSWTVSLEREIQALFPEQ
jgi:hypothetical protein